MPPKPTNSSGNYLAHPDWKNQITRPRGVDLKNGVYFIQDVGPAKNSIYVTADEVLPLKELSFFLIWRYQKTYTRQSFEQIHGKMYQAIGEYVLLKRPSLEGIPGLMNGIPFGDKQYRFKQAFYTGYSIPMQMQGAKFVMGISIDKIIAASGMEVKNPQDFANAYKEIKTIIAQELDYMGRNPALQKKPEPNK